MNKQHTLWIEKYRSENLEQYIGNDAVKARIADCITKNDIPHFLFAGTAGTGKTTLAKLIVKNIKCDYLYINASDENGIDIIRDKVKGFASTSTFQPLKVVILDESDFLTQPAQAALRNLIEEYSITTRFILTCNYIERLIEPLQSRCEFHLLKPPTKGAVAKHICTNILDVEKVTYKMEDIAQVVNAFYPDVRSIIKVLQQNAILDHLSGETILVVDKLDANWTKQLILILNKRDKSAWYQVRQLVADAQVDDFQTTYRYMFEHLSEFSYGNDANIIILLDEYSYRANVCPDKELNFAAFINSLLNITTKNIIKG
jgi:replication factor C small subunit